MAASQIRQHPVLRLKNSDAVEPEWRVGDYVGHGRSRAGRREEWAIAGDIERLPRSGRGEVGRPFHLETAIGDLRVGDFDRSAKLPDADFPGIGLRYRIGSRQILQQ